MRYRRALFVAGAGKDAAPDLAVLRRVAPRLEHLLVVAELATPAFGWLLGERSPEPDEAETAWLATLQEATAGAAPSVEVKLAPALDADALSALSISEDIDLLVFAERSLRSAWVVSAERKRQRAAVLWSGGQPASGPLREIVCVVYDERSRADVAAFLRDHAAPSMRVTLLSPTPLPPDVLAASLRIAGIEAAVEVSSLLDAPSAQDWIEEWTRERRIDLLVFAQASAALLASALRASPVLLLPPSAARAPAERALDVPDLVDDGGPLRASFDEITAVGTPVPLPDHDVAFVSGGHVVVTLTTRAGVAELPAGLAAGPLGVFRSGEDAPLEPLAAIEEQLTVIGVGNRPLVLADAELPDDALRALAGLAASSRTEVVAVRMRPTASFRAIRARLREVGLSPRVVCARLVLDEGDALDVSDALDAVRLARVASRLQRAGHPISAIVHQGAVEPCVSGFAALTPGDLAGSSVILVAARPVTSPAGEETTSGNRVELELDNAKARRWLLEAIAESKRTVHFQVYMGVDDDASGPVEAALAAAAARGVAVRVLIDSLHGLHGSFGVRNPLFERLAARPGVELRALRPITELPQLTALKQRDHRKLVVADGRLALLGGRNLSHEYYTGFDEVRITPESPWRQVPWLDAGARVTGPAVSTLEASFLATWREAGGAPFEVAAPQVTGGSTARVVIHRGLRDARTLETYLELIASARSHIHVVTGFPLLLELQHALLRALRRGVRVRTLTGCPTPTHDGQPFGGPWATARNAATELVHSRLDPIVEAGGETVILARRDVPGWAPELGVVHPHVHAKLMTVDGSRCSVGSANMDVTASYWESELLLVVEDAGLVRALEAELDALMTAGTPVRRDDPAWRQLADRRAWMRHWPGVLSV